MNKYSLRSFVLLWVAAFVFSFAGFIYLILNLFFSEHITTSSLKDLKYTAHVVQLNLSEERMRMSDALARHITSPEFLFFLKSGKLGEVRGLIENWNELLKIDRIQIYDKTGGLLNLLTGKPSEDDVALSSIVLNQLNKGYEQTTYTAKNDGLTISLQRKIIGEGHENLGYLFEQKKILFVDLLKKSDGKDLIVSDHGEIIYTSESLKEARRLTGKNLLRGASLFSIHFSGKDFEVFRLDIASGVTFFLAKENLKAEVFKSFYKKYLIYFGIYITFLVLLFYLSYRIQVFKPLRQISKFIIERKGGQALQVETSVYEISLIAEKLKEKLLALNDDVEKNKKGRVEDMSRLVASVAHELNNSLSYLGGNLEYLKEELDGGGEIDKEEISGAIISAQSGYERIKKIVSDLRVFSSKRELEIEWNPLCDLKGRVEEEFKKLDVSFPAELSEYEVKVDEARTFQIIKNLIINAEQAYSADEINKKILLSFYLENSSLIISVKDWAGGIPQEVESKVFEPFFTTKKNTGGAGLGLALSQTLAREMDADLFLKETGAEGTAFCFKMKHFRPKS